MPYTHNAGIRIHYEVDGTGPPLVLQHGFTHCVKDWVECGYVAALRPTYRLISVDARGHGDSDKPHDEDSYTLDRRVADVIAVLDSLGVEKAHFWGYSMGGYIGFGMAKYAPQRVNALVIGGQHPFARDQTGMRQWLRNGMAGGGDVLISDCEKMVGPLSNGLASRLRAADLEAYLAAAHDRIAIDDVLETMAMPSCLYAGEADPIFMEAKLASERISDARFFAIPELAHLPAFVTSSSVLPSVMAFLHYVH